MKIELCHYFLQHRRAEFCIWLCSRSEIPNMRSGSSLSPEQMVAVCNMDFRLILRTWNMPAIFQRSRRAPLATSLVSHAVAVYITNAIHVFATEIDRFGHADVGNTSVTWIWPRVRGSNESTAGHMVSGCKPCCVSMMRQGTQCHN